MKATSIISIILILGLGIFVSRCSDNAEEEVLQEAPHYLYKSSKAFLQDISEFKKAATRRIESNERKIEDYKKQISKRSAFSKAVYEQKIEDLEEQNESLKLRLKDHRATGKDQWVTFKKEFTTDMDELGTAFQNFFN